ncbi:uncharacterized protein VTP21DRAFT_4550 [Calcarisporiella thermophila]|uniref:uncharacterized protein n=1 Tax=Calcarisporiella thermophila TaxID=911321 RepID=UPI003742A3CF
MSSNQFSTSTEPRGNAPSSGQYHAQALQDAQTLQNPASKSQKRVEGNKHVNPQAGMYALKGDAPRERSGQLSREEQAEEVGRFGLEGREESIHAADTLQGWDSRDMVQDSKEVQGRLGGGGGPKSGY